MTDKTRRRDAETLVHATDRTALSRRQMLKLSGAAGIAVAAGLGAPATARAEDKVKTGAHIVIVGAGAAGISVASRVMKKLDGARVTIIDKREKHHYQPGYTLVASGVWKKTDVLVDNAGYIPREVDWIKGMVVDYDPEANAIFTDGGRRVEYDYLVVAPGCQLNYDAIEGMSRDLIGREGIGSVYASNDHAAKTWQALQRFIENGGQGVYTAPDTAIKCAGAPLKIQFLTIARMFEAGTRSKAKFDFHTPFNGLFSAPVFNDAVVGQFQDKDITPHYGRKLVAIDPGKRQATFATDNGADTVDYDFIHVVPPMTAPDAVANSALAWTDGNFARGGWLEVDRHTLRHRRYANVFGCGDVVGTPYGKTAASVKKQAPVVAQNLVDVIAGREPSASYDGYTSCPMITDIGKAMLVEFDYSGDPTPTVPLLDPTVPRWMWWKLKTDMLLPMYLHMLRGRTDFI